MNTSEFSRMYPPHNWTPPATRGGHGCPVEKDKQRQRDISNWLVAVEDFIGEEYTSIVGDPIHFSTLGISMRLRTIFTKRTPVSFIELRDLGQAIGRCLAKEMMAKKSLDKVLSVW